MDLLRQVFYCMRDFCLKLQSSTCTMACSEVAFLGHTVSGDNIRPDPKLLSAIRDILPHTVSLKELQSYLGLVGY